MCDDALNIAIRISPSLMCDAALNIAIRISPN